MSLQERVYHRQDCCTVARAGPRSVTSVRSHLTTNLSERHKLVRARARQANYGSRRTGARSDCGRLSIRSTLLERNNTAPIVTQLSHAIYSYKAQRSCLVSCSSRLQYSIIASVTKLLPLRLIILLHVPNILTLLGRLGFDPFGQQQAMHAGVILLVYVVCEPGSGPVATAAGRPCERSE